MRYYLYKMIHLPTGRVYIGQHKIPKGKTPFNDGYRGSGKIWKRIYKKHPDECVKVVIGLFATKEEVNEAEISLIKHYKSVWGSFCVNITEGGEGWSHKHSKESIQKMIETKRNWSPEKRKEVSENVSKAHKGKPAWNKGVSPSAEAIEKNRQAHLGRKASDETRAKMSKSQRGRKHTEESRKKMSEVAKGRVISQEQRAKISATLKGRKLPPEVVEKMSEARKGRVISQEQRAKISATLKGRKRPPEVVEKLKGRKCSDEERKRRSEALKGKPWTEARRAAYLASKNRKENEI